MEEKILHKATDQFLTLGFKSVTMDDLAASLGISKKTIYGLFPNKTALVREVMNSLFIEITTGVHSIQDSDTDAVTKMLQVRHLLHRVLRNERSAPQHQLMKYYSAIHEEINQRAFQHMQDTVKANLIQGQQQGLYRPEIDCEVALRFYYQGCMNCKDIELYPPEQFPIAYVQDQFIEFFLRGIVTPTGLTILTQGLNQGR